MKKLMTAIVALLITVSIGFAQNTKSASSPKAKDAKTAHVQPAVSAAKMKKDGTPDKRFKENKPTQHLKKDGTPDMRYKENKAKK